MQASLFVSKDVYSQAEKLLRARQGKDVLQAVELLLQNDLAFSTNDKENVTVFSVGQKEDAGALLHDGLSYLQSKPFEVLDIPIGAQTIDIRKAYKKCALKYHPDKNPRTTALFQCIQTASDKLSDRDKRKVEENKQKSAAKFSMQPPAKPAPNDLKKPSKPSSAAYSCSSNPKTSAQAHSQKSSSSSSSSSSQMPRNDPYNPSSHESGNQKSNYNNDADLANKAKMARDKREAQMKEYLFNLERARQHKDDILKEAQKAFNSYRDEGKQRTDCRSAKEDVPSAPYGKFSGPDPNPTPDNYRYRGDETYLRGYKGNNKIPVYNTRTTYEKDVKVPSKHGDVLKSVPTANTPKSNFNSDNSPPHVTGTTFTVNSNGDVRTHDSKKVSTTKSSSKSSNLLTAPMPCDLRVVSTNDTNIELEWTVPALPLTASKLLFELNWRNNTLGHIAWEKTANLLTLHICRKKNLTPNTAYEFRVRSVVELPGGMLGERSLWTKSIIIQTKELCLSSNSTSSKPKDTSTSNKMNKNVFNEFSGIKIDDEESDFDFQYDPVIDTWLMSYDSNTSHYYYYNQSTGESQWEAPEWVEEDDGSTGSKYYVKLDKYTSNPLHSTWSRPKNFAKLVRPV